MTPPDVDDLIQIHALLADYGATLDEMRWNDHTALWTEDAELHVFGRSYRGREAIEGFMRKAVHGKHVTAVPHLEFQGDRARSVADFVFFRSSDLALHTAGVYRDDLLHTNAGWRFGRREIEIQLREGKS